MKVAQIVHNPTAGNGKHTKKDLLHKVEKEGFETKYVSTDETGWEDFLKNEPDVIFLAGGDGTVHKLAAVLLKAPIVKRRIPIHLFPHGTANNIATTLKIPSNVSAHEINFNGRKLNFDNGSITGLEEQNFFLESVGMGIFPELISEMKKKDIEAETLSEKLQRTLEVLLKIIRNFKAEEAEIVADDITIKGKFLMVELMNIKYVGPNLKLAPAADPGDGYFDLVLIPEESRRELQDYLLKLIKDDRESLDVREFSKTIRAKKVEFKRYRTPAHIDDDLNDTAKSFTVSVQPAGFQFLEITSEK
ncbi:diacylglycerol kinase [Salinimicrobium marinum]|uniref:Diacylglycerol kinase n=1 Tax=Salinimicrobium marinum TaxID=680283 RepID=A0A918SJR8_9FLAO|nr:diacylglycerol kinase family protein [Salinimicrobium marinum]GHA44338.1 diacylglycerol kinase [Salinimicrobium marinum]